MKKFAVLLAALLALIGLAGCIAVPVYEPGYRPYGHGYYDQGYPYYGSGYYRRRY